MEEGGGKKKRVEEGDGGCGKKIKGWELEVGGRKMN